MTRTTCVINIDAEIIESARVKAEATGTSLKSILEQVITDLAAMPADTEWVVERALMEQYDKSIRQWLYNLRKRKVLKLGRDYRREGRSLYYRVEAVKRHLGRRQK